MHMKHPEPHILHKAGAGWGQMDKMENYTDNNFSKAICHFFLVLVLERVNILIFPCKKEVFQFSLMVGAERT